VIVVVVLSRLQFVVEYLGIVDDDPIEQAVEFFDVDTRQRSTLPLSRSVRGFDVDVTNADVRDAKRLRRMLNRDHLWGTYIRIAPLSPAGP
jgi:hypothetical protein